MRENLTLSKNDALIIVDMQNDFLLEGAFPIPEGDQIIPIINDYIDLFRRGANIFATRDWHPPNHISFKDRGGSWPPHCLQESEGAMISSKLRLPSITTTISKGTDPERESYSVFQQSKLVSNLKENQVSRVFVGGLATEYCVKNTVLDALEQGFEVFLLTDAIGGINVHPGDAEKAVMTMISKGAKGITLVDFPESLEILPEEPASEGIAEKPLSRAYLKKKARMRSRGPYRKAKIEK